MKKTKGNYNFKGEKNNNSKLNWESVKLIRETYVKGKNTHSYFAKLFGVTRKNIGDVLAGKTWVQEELK